MDDKMKVLAERLINAATMHRKHPCEVYDMVALANEAAATIRAQAEKIERLNADRNAYKKACEMAGVCMSCVLGASAPEGCTDCLGTGFVGGGPHNMLDAVVAVLGIEDTNRDPADEVKAWIVRAEAAEAELARIRSAEGCDVEGALDAYMDAPNKGLPYDSLVQQRMSAALAVGCAPLRAKLALYETALRKIACWHVVAPEVNYPHYASMAVVTAREIVPQKEPTDGNP